MREIGNVECIGTTARNQIVRRDCVGRVLAVVRGAVYLSVTPALACGASVARSSVRQATVCVAQSSDATKQSPNRSLGIASQKPLAMTDEVLWLSQNHLPMHPRAIRGEFDFGVLHAGMTFESDGECLQFEMGDHTGSPLRFADASVWQPPMIDSARVTPREMVMARIQDLEGFAQAPSRSLRELVGLGEGLTPSGDDFIGGLLFAQWHLHQAYPGSVKWNQTAVDELIDYARTRTNVISHAILRDHARGQSIEPMHNLIVGLLQSKSPDKIMPHVQELIAIGNTSGREMLAGLLAGMLSIGTEN